LNIRLEELANRAIEVLKSNWRDGFTIPTDKLYPFQWNWDSGFVSLGHGHHNLDWAIVELERLFSGQWENGMIPHILFHNENIDTYFPNHDFWMPEVNSGSPKNVRTSGITQPPVHGFILEYLFKRNPNNNKLKDFIRAIYSKVVKSHDFFYTYRDPKSEGLAFIYHPWETGRDNSPLWDESMDRIVVDYTTLPKYERKDLNHADNKQRPTQEHYDKYVYLLELGKKFKYDEQGIAENSPLLIQDSMLNAILIRSNESLINLGKALNLDTGKVEEWQQQSKRTFNEKLWSNKLNFYTCYDMVAEKQIDTIEIGGLVTLFANLPDKNQAASLKEYLEDLHSKGYNLCPSFDVDHELFDSQRYWRGPVWPQMDWMIYHGLKQYGFYDLASILKDDFIGLVSKLGFYEYFESEKNKANQLDKGYGGNNFSWTASSILDLIKAS